MPETPAQVFARGRKIREDRLTARAAGGENKDMPTTINPDAIPERMCPNCGLQGHHAKLMECIDALRSELAVAQFRARQKRREV